MSLARVLLPCLVTVLLFLAAAGLGAGPASAETAKAAPEAPFIDQALPFYGCGIGASIGAASVAFPRAMTQWTFYAGVYPSMAVVLWRSTLGCFYGIAGGAGVSALQSTARAIGDAWQRHF